MVIWISKGFPSIARDNPVPHHSSTECGIPCPYRKKVLLEVLHRVSQLHIVYMNPQSRHKGFRDKIFRCNEVVAGQYIKGIEAYIPGIHPLLQPWPRFLGQPIISRGTVLQL